jgi:hypothetical protein
VSGPLAYASTLFAPPTMVEFWPRHAPNARAQARAGTGRLSLLATRAMTFTRAMASGTVSRRPDIIVTIQRIERRATGRRVS